jgi:uncharacterized protein (DUF1501 family)
VLGGKVAGGRVLANWPGLGGSNLFDNRDLQPTMDARSLAKGLLARQFNLDPHAQVMVFPDSGQAMAAGGLMRA